MKSCVRLVLVFSVASLLTAAKAPPPVQIEIRPEVYAEHTFSPGHVPPHSGFMPSIEAGLCDTRFSPQTRVGIQWHRLGFRGITANITLVQITMSMQVNVYLEEGTGPAVAAHEATHRAISEHYYAMADRVAREIADGVIRRKISLPHRNQDAAAREAVDEIEHEILATLDWRVVDRCDFAQERYDDITDHGRNAISNADAMKRALAEEAAHWAQVKDQPPPPLEDEGGIRF